MVNTNSTDSLESWINFVQQPDTQAEGEGPSLPTIKATVQGEGEGTSGPSPTAGAGSPGPGPSIPAFQSKLLSPWAQNQPSIPWAQDQPSTLWAQNQPSTPWGTYAGPQYQQLLPTDDGENWRKLYEKVDQFDKEFYDGWISEIDSIPTFAGLLAAVVTAFVVESYKLLQPDPQEIINHTLLNISAQLAGGLGTDGPPSFTPSSSSFRINIFWFLSLTCTLMAGLVAILCKQWLRQYHRRDFSLPHKEALAFRQLRYEGMLQWKVTGILSALPILLTLGLILFFIGLVDFLHSQVGMRLVSIPVTIFIGVGFAFLMVTTSAPAFQYIIARYSWKPFRPILFAFKSPQSLAILHLATWLFPPPPNFKNLPNWTSWEFMFFSDDTTIRTYAEHALTWIHETYSHSLDIVYQICLCLQDIEDQDLEVGNIAGSDPMLWDFVRRESRSMVIKPLFNPIHPVNRANQAESHDVIAMRYLSSSEALAAMSFDQILTIVKRSMHNLSYSRRQVSSFDAFRSVFVRLSTQAAEYTGYPIGTSPFQGVIQQRAILFQKLLSEGRWTDSTGIPIEVRHVSENLRIFSDEDLNSIFGAVRAWIDQHPQDVDLPSHCWVALTSKLKFYEFDPVVQGRHCDRQPVCDFLTFLDPRFQMGDGIEYLCRFWYYGEKEFDSFFMVLYAWIEQNPQDARSFTNCQTLLASVDPQNFKRVRQYRSFRDFEAPPGLGKNPKLIRQRAIRFWSLLSMGQWEEPTKISEEVWTMLMNLGIFTDEDLDSIFNALHVWIVQHPEDADLPSQCWVSLTSRLKPHELDEALQHRPPVRDFMAFLDSRFQMGEGIKYMCDTVYNGIMADSFFTALYTWLDQNPQDTPSFIHCQKLLATVDSGRLKRARGYQFFCGFEAFLEAQVLENKDGGERGRFHGL